MKSFDRFFFGTAVLLILLLFALLITAPPATYPWARAAALVSLPVLLLTFAVVARGLLRASSRRR